MTEEVKEQMTDDAKKELADASINRIKMIAKMAKDYYRALNNDKISSLELFMVGCDTVMAGFQLISRSNDMDLLNVDDRIKMMGDTLATLNDTVRKVYLNPEVVAGMVAKAAMEDVQRKGLAKTVKKEEK